MKIPETKATNVRQFPQQTTPIPAAYLAMAAAHMQSMGKQVFQPQGTSTDQQPPAVTNAPSN